MLKDLLQAFFEPIDIVVYQVVLIDLTLINEANQGQALVHFPQVEHYVLRGVRMPQPNKRTGLLIEFAAATFIIDAIDARHIDQHVDQLRTNLVVHHVNWGRVSSNVDFGHDIKKKSFLNVTPTNQCVHHH